MTSVQNIRLTWRLTRPPPPPSAAAASAAKTIIVMRENPGWVGPALGSRLWELPRGSLPKPRTQSPKPLLESELERDQQRDDDGEQRSAFDERGEDQRTGLDGAGDFRLARHAFGGGTTDAADAEASADHGEAGADGGTHHRPRARVRGVEPGGVGDFLQHGKNRHFTCSRENMFTAFARAACCQRFPSA